MLSKIELTLRKKHFLRQGTQICTNDVGCNLAIRNTNFDEVEYAVMSVVIESCENLEQTDVINKSK